MSGNEKQHRDTYQADENRYLYYFYAPVVQLLTPAMLKHRNDEQMIGWRHLNREFNDARITKFVPNAAADNAVAATYHGRMVEGIGVLEGAYSVVETDGRTRSAHELLATDNLRDCVALVLVGKNRNHPNHAISILAHIDAVTDVTREVTSLLKHIPTGYAITATMLGGPDRENYYVETDMVRSLKTDARIEKIQINTEDAKTVLLDVASGHIFVSNHNTTAKPYAIAPHAFPVTTNITFYDHQGGKYYSTRYLEWPLLVNRTSLNAPSPRTAALFPLVVKDHHMVSQETTLEAQIESMTSKGALSREQLAQLGKKLRSELHLPVNVTFDPKDESVDVTANGSIIARVPVPHRAAGTGR